MVNWYKKKLKEYEDTIKKLSDLNKDVLKNNKRILSYWNDTLKRDLWWLKIDLVLKFIILIYGILVGIFITIKLF